MTTFKVLADLGLGYSDGVVASERELQVPRLRSRGAPGQAG
jgi:hypothetical protein